MASMSLRVQTESSRHCTSACLLWVDDFRVSIVVLDHCCTGGSVARVDLKSSSAAESFSAAGCCISG